MSLNEMEEQIERLYIDMENELLLNIADKISQGKPMEINKWDLETNSPIYGSGNVNQWQLERLKELGGLTEKNIKIISKYSGKTKEEIEQIFERAREIGTELDKNTIELGIKAGILNEVNPVVEDTLVKSILTHSINETLTTFNQQNNSLLRSAGNEYTNIVNKVSNQVLSGTKTVDKAMQEAVSDLAQKGLTGFTAKNGAHWTPEAYTKMVLHTNTQNTINNIQEERIKQAGGDYWQINQYAGARPKCSEDQGKVFSASGNTEDIYDLNGRKIEVRSWSNSSYGEPDGILGINCGHSRHLFIPGVSIYRSKPIPKKENDDAYIEKQQQRLYERTIRNKKREVAMLKKTGAEDTYIKQKTSQLSSYRKEYVDFLDKTGRTRRTGSEWIGSSTLSSKATNKINKSYNSWKTKEDKAKKQAEIIKQSIIGKFDITKYTDTIKTTTDEVVLLPERLVHLKKHKDIIKYIDKIGDILNKPDSVYKQLDKEDTIWIVKKYEDNVKVTVKLNTVNSKKKYKNSVIQMQILNQKRIEKYIGNGKIEILFDKNNKK